MKRKKTRILRWSASWLLTDWRVLTHYPNPSPLSAASLRLRTLYVCMILCMEKKAELGWFSEWLSYERGCMRKWVWERLNWKARRHWRGGGGRLLSFRRGLFVGTDWNDDLAHIVEGAFAEFLEFTTMRLSLRMVRYEGDRSALRVWRWREPVEEGVDLVWGWEWHSSSEVVVLIVDRRRRGNVMVS